MMKVAQIFLLGLFSCILLTACSGQPATPNFQQLVLPQTPNYYLACPPKFCNVMPMAYTPVYPVSADDLFNDFNLIISTEPRVQFVNNIPEQGEFMLVAKSVFGLADDITVQFIALSDTTSTLAIYSRSRYSYIDLGANKRRVDKWLALLSQMTTTVATAANNPATPDQTTATTTPATSVPATTVAPAVANSSSPANSATSPASPTTPNNTPANNTQ